MSKLIKSKSHVMLSRLMWASWGVVTLETLLDLMHTKAFMGLLAAAGALTVSALLAKRAAAAEERAAAQTDAIARAIRDHATVVTENAVAAVEEHTRVITERVLSFPSMYQLGLEGDVSARMAASDRVARMTSTAPDTGPFGAVR
ncbi:hypothetical protein [Acrocarpospora catenulata]|uniref:hypothetical protein n=1 Tax=Acrocarpospora catenulata TaxID=2836182 RepID=UPI001BDA984A|nr:hypothetical protein [Acrocarpospora catenulata]